MIKENIKILDNLRPEETRFNFDPLNRNLCFGVGGGGSGNPIENWWDATTSIFRGESGGGDEEVETEGGLSEQDQAMKDLIYGKMRGLFDKEYQPFTGERYTPRSQGELDMLTELQEGGGYKDLYDKASTDLGFTKKAYKDAAGYDLTRLDQDAEQLMGAGSTYRSNVANKILQDMNRGASMSGMDLTGQAHGSGAFGGDRALVARNMSNLGYQRQAGDALTNLHYGAYTGSLDRARQSQQDRLAAAHGYGSTVMTDLGIGTEGLDKKYKTSMEAYGADRAFGDRGLDFDYKQWQDKQNYPWKQFGALTGLYSGMPFEEKVVTSNTSSGGK